MIDPKNTICRDLWGYPVIELVRPKIRTCCKRQGTVISQNQLDELGTDVFLNLPSTQQERLDMMSGKQIKGCDVCWSLENKGLKSFRSNELDFQFHFNNDVGEPIHWSKFRPFEKLIEDKETLITSNMPNKIDLSLGTFCDQKCIYCNSDYSTQWETEDKAFGKYLNSPTEFIRRDSISINSQTIDGYYEKFVEWFDTVYQHLERIALMGGEPTFSPLFIPLIDHLISRLKIKSHPNCTISIVTNLNWKKNVLEKILYLKSEIPNIKIVLEISMESVGEKAEYIRTGVSWSRFLDNLNIVAAIDGIEIVLLPSMNALCVSSILDYLKVIKQIEDRVDKKFKMIGNRIVKPMWLGMGILGKEHSHYIKNAIEWIDNNYAQDAETKAWLRNVLLDIVNEIELPRNDLLLGFFSQWIKEMDKRRNLNFEKVFPELANLILEGSNYAKKTYDIEMVASWK
jgi:organic radical activating enzyme